MTDFHANRISAESTSSPYGNLLVYKGSVGTTYKVWLKNLFFMIITLGIYRAWAKTRMRKYLWAHTVIDGDRLNYTGTGGELFRGYLKVALLFFVVSLLSILATIYILGDDVETTQEQTAQQKQAAEYAALAKCGYTAENWHEVTSDIYSNCLKEQKQKGDEEKESLTSLVSNLIVVPFFVYVGLFMRYSSLRYRLSRTSWRGIRGSMRGSANKYTVLSFGRLLLNIISLGFLIPKSDMARQAYIMRDMYIGNQKAQFNNDTTGLMKTHIITALLAFPTFALSRLWYSAALKNKKLANTSFGAVTLRGTYTGGKLASLYIINILLFIFTFGLGIPIIINRTIHFHATNTVVSGNIASTTILQGKSDAGNMGEGFDNALDSGLDIDFGFI